MALLKCGKTESENFQLSINLWCLFRYISCGIFVSLTVLMIVSIIFLAMDTHVKCQKWNGQIKYENILYIFFISPEKKKRRRSRKSWNDEIKISIKVKHLEAENCLALGRSDEEKLGNSNVAVKTCHQ